MCQAAAGLFYLRKFFQFIDSKKIGLCQRNMVKTKLSQGDVNKIAALIECHELEDEQANFISVFNKYCVPEEEYQQGQMSFDRIPETPNPSTCTFPLKGPSSGCPVTCDISG